ncbi:hypothetical protein JOF53_005007 [Crossiella equi]|uniref:Uncharacterized protein n=1 Tax=Crossiella equi TaxID=130796 RepID=A0ABS5AHT5_9PSEU|nr:hypothetical protein [Crossiella equi]MBP2476135.1 hypothetical protein [Crossiella equi]
MSTDGTPSRVGLAMRVPGGWVRIAEYQLGSDGTVTLSVLDEQRGGIARHFYEDGVDFHAERRMVRPAEGAVFMRALLRQANMSYYRFSDDSGTTTS